MKTRFSKKLLSAFLAVVMVVTSIPMFALTASAATVEEEMPVISFDFKDSSLYSSTAAGANPTVRSSDGNFTLSTGPNTNNETGGFAQYDSAGLSVSKGHAELGIAKQTLTDNFKITLKTTVGSPMNNSDRCIISMGNNGSWNNILDWTCGEIHVLSPGTVAGTAGDGTHNFTNPYEDTGLSTFEIQMYNGTLTLKYNGTVLYTQANCGIKGSEIDYIRIFDDDSWWGGTGVIESFTASNIVLSTVDNEYYKRYISQNLAADKSQSGYCVYGAADGSYNKDKLFGTIAGTDRDKMSSVLYTAGVVNHWGNTLSQESMQAGFQFGPIVFLDDGTSEMACPISIFQKRTALTGTYRLRYVSVTSAGFELKKNWQGGEKNAGYKTNGSNRLGIDLTTDTPSINSRDQLYYSNTLYCTNRINTGYKKYTIYGEVCTTKTQAKGEITSKNSSDDSKSGYVYILNYKPIVNIYNTARAEFDAVVAKECKYTESALTAYYTALYNVLLFDLGATSNDYSSEAGVEAAANKIQNLANTYSTAYSNLINLESSLNKDTSANSTHSFADTVVAPTCTTDGYTRHICSVCQFEYTDSPVSATGHEVNYVYAPVTNTTHRVSCSKGDMTAFTENCTDSDHDGDCDKCGQSLIAVFDEYNNERGLLLGMLKDDAFSAADLEALNEAISAMTYFNYTDAQKEAEPGTSQPAINAEAQQLRELRTALKEYSLDISAAEAAAGDFSNAVEDIDRYDTSALEAYNSDKDAFYKKSVTVAGTSYSAFLFDSQTELNAAVANIVESLNDPANVRNYTVYIDGEPCVDASGSAVKVPYGTAVTVDGDGTINVDVEDTNANYDGDPIAWRYSYAAPSTNNKATAAKYMITSPSFGFIVKGDTYLTTSKAKADGPSYVVTVVSNVKGKVIDKVATSGSYVMPYAPSYTGYAFSSYSNGAVGGQNIIVTADTTITAEYAVDQSYADQSYVIDYYDGLLGYLYNAGYYEGGEIVRQTAYYNQLVKMPEASDVFCWAVADYNDDGGIDLTVISYGSSYSFYACESYTEDLDTGAMTGIVSLTREEYEIAVGNYVPSTRMSTLDDGDYGVEFTVYDTQGNQIKNLTGNVAIMDYNYTYADNYAEVTSLEELKPIYNSYGYVAKYAMIGHYILPEGYSMVECGFIYTADTSVTDLNLNSVDNVKTFRFKSSRYTVGNQFVINLVNDSQPTTFNYVPYAIVKNGNQTTTVYGTVHENVTIN